MTTATPPTPTAGPVGDDRDPGGRPPGPPDRAGQRSGWWRFGYPVALALSPGVQEEGPFGLIDRIPTLVVLDARGREVTRRFGNMTEEEIEEALASAESN